MEPELVDPAAIRERAEAVCIGLCTSVVMPGHADPTGDDEAVREGLAFLKAVRRETAAGS